ncbi:MAG: class I SAM-dependent rRNA methyltransferase [Nitrospirota bacterium]
MSGARSSDEPVTLRLRTREAARPRAGHPWIYRNEVEAIPPGLAPGGQVTIVDDRGRFVGRGYANPASVILARLLTWRDEAIDETWWAGRLKAAIALRARLRPDSAALRLVFSEGDGLPGLVVDRYGGVVVVQALTAGIERWLATIVSILNGELRPEAILARHDVGSRKLEGLPVEKRWLHGQREGPVALSWRGFQVKADCWNGQKTGLYLDQADNYALVGHVIDRSGGARVLDGACYTGLWSLHAARAGAGEVIGIDLSESAIATAQEQAAENGLADRCHFLVGNLFDELKRRSEAGETFDLVVLDPPSFVKSRARIADALRGYKEINLRAMKLLRPGGFLLTCSCSYHVRPELFRAVLHESAADVGRSARLIAWRGQALDHPALLALPESDYLKCALLQVI